MRRFFTVILILGCFFLSMTALAKKKSDQLGENELRLVSLKPNITLSLMSLDLANQIVGMTKYCKKPNGQAKVIADYNNVNIEEVIRLKPDFVIGSHENSKQTQYDSLRQAGIKVVLLSFQTIRQMKASITQIGELTGKKEKAEELIAQIDQKIVQIASQVAKMGYPSFILLVQRRPLMVATRNTFFSSLLERVGFRNVFAANQVAYPVLDEEEFIREEARYVFDISHQSTENNQFFLNKPVTGLDISQFLASPLALDSLSHLVENLSLTK